MIFTIEINDARKIILLKSSFFQLPKNVSGMKIAPDKHQPVKHLCRRGRRQESNILEPFGGSSEKETSPREGNLMRLCKREQ